MLKLLKIPLGVFLLCAATCFLLRGMPFEAAINYVAGAWLIFGE